MGLVDFDALLYDPAYAVFGEDAVLTLADTAGTEINLTAIDKTAGIVVGANNRFNADRFNTEVDTIAPAAIVRAPDLAGVQLADLAQATLALNGKTWTVVNHAARPSPKGEAAGEILLILSEAG